MDFINSTSKMGNAIGGIPGISLLIHQYRAVLYKTGTSDFTFYPKVTPSKMLSDDIMLEPYPNQVYF